jgi:hypothetical protein
LVGVLIGAKVGVGPPNTAKHCENSDVLLPVSVAVAVMTDPAETVTGSVTLKVALQDGSVEGVAMPKKVFPCPNPEGSQDGLAKNSIRNGPELAALSRVPWMLIELRLAVAEVMTGKFWKLLGPVTVSQW